MVTQPKTQLKRKQFGIDAALLASVEGLARDTHATLDNVIDEALRDLLKKHRRPLTLKDALRESARALPANDADRNAAHNTRKERGNARPTTSSKGET